MPPRAYFVGPTAAALHELPARLHSHTLESVHVGVPPGTRRIDATGITAHRGDVSEADLVELSGARLTGVERTWIDLAAFGSIDLDDLVAIGDAIIWRRRPRSTPVRLEAALARYRGRRGVRLLRAALPLLTDRADSPAESLLRVAIWRAGLPAPEINRRVLDSAGRFLATPDLSWPGRRVLLEYEGDHHRSDRRQWHIDLERYARLQDAGWFVLRAAAPDLHDPSKLLRRLRRLLGS